MIFSNCKSSANLHTVISLKGDYSVLFGNCIRKIAPLPDLKLFYIQHQTLEVLALGVVDVDRMVGRLRELMEDAYAATALCRGAEYCQTELLLRYSLRAGEGEQNTAVGYLLEGLGIKTAIALQGVVEGAAVLGEGRWVKDDEVMLA